LIIFKINFTIICTSSIHTIFYLTFFRIFHIFWDIWSIKFKILYITLYIALLCLLATTQMVLLKGIQEYVERMCVACGHTNFIIRFLVFTKYQFTNAPINRTNQTRDIPFAIRSQRLIIYTHTQIYSWWIFIKLYLFEFFVLFLFNA